MKRKANKENLRTKVFTMRIDSELKYLAEIACRVRRCSLPQFIEHAIKDEIEHEYIRIKRNV